MSLIADSLKKANKDKVSEWTAPPDFNLLSGQAPPGGSKLAAVLRFVFLIVLPAAVLIGLVALGAFQLRLEPAANSPAPGKEKQAATASPSVFVAKPESPVAAPEVSVAPSGKTPEQNGQPSADSKFNARVEAPQVASQPAPVPQPAARNLSQPATKLKRQPQIPKPLVDIRRSVTPPVLAEATKESGARNVEIKQVSPDSPEVRPVPRVEAFAVNGDSSRALLQPLERRNSAKTNAFQIDLSPAEKVDSGTRSGAAATQAPVKMRQPEEKFSEAVSTPSEQARSAASVAEPRALPQQGLSNDVPLQAPEAASAPDPATVQEPDAATASVLQAKEIEEAVAVASSSSTTRIRVEPPGEPESRFESSDYFFNRAVFYQQAKEWDKALTAYGRASELNPDNPEIYNNKGVILKEMGRYDAAVEEFLRAVYLRADYGKAYNNIGVVYYLQKNNAEAIRNYRKAIEIDPANLEAFNNLAIVYRNRGEPEKARAVLDKALSQDADHPGTNYNLGVLYEAARETGPALHYYRRFIEVGATDHPSLVLQVKEHVKTLEPR